MIELLILGGAVGGISAGYIKVRHFVRDRLRFVDEVQRPVAAVGTGVVAALAAAPVVWLLPVVGAGTAVVFGAGMGLAVSHGAKDVRKQEHSLPYV